MGERDLLTFETKLVGVTICPGGRTGGAFLILAIKAAELTFVVVVDLATTFHVQAEIVILVRGQAQAGAQVMRAALDRRGAALAHFDAVAVAQVGRFAIEQASAQLQAQQAIDQRATGVDAGVAGIAEVAVFLVGVVLRQRSGPFLGHLAGNDVDHAAHGVRTIERRHRAADDFDAFDGRQWRHEAGGRFVEAVGRDIARRVLTAPVDKDQGVLARHAADADIQSAGLARALADVDTFHVAQSLRQVVVALLLQIFTADDADARRCFGDLLFEAGGADDRVVERDRRVLGQGRPAAADHGAGQGSTCEGDRHAGSL